MKNYLKWLVTLAPVIFLSIMLTNCSDEPEVKPEAKSKLEIETTASAQAEDDKKSSGVYKGTFFGSSGTFKLTIQSDTIVGVLLMDNALYILHTSDIDSDNLYDGIVNALFTDKHNKIKLRFSVEANGNYPTVELEIVGQTDVKAVVLKETSDSQVKVYEGFRYCIVPEYNRQVKYTLNAALDVDSLISFVCKTHSGKSLTTGWPVTPSIEWFFMNLEYYYQDDQLVPHYMGETIDMLCNGSSHYDISEDDFSGHYSWTYNTVSYTDSLRLVRKL